MHPQCDPCVEHSIDVEVVTVELSLQPDGAADAHAADQPSNSIAQDVGAIEGFLNQAWIAGPHGDLAYGGPFRTFNAVRAIPFGIFRNHNAALVRRDRPRAADLAFVLEYIRMQGTLIRIVAPLNTYRIDGKIEGIAGGGRVVAEVPQAQTVVAIDRLDHVGLGV